MRWFGHNKRSIRNVWRISYFMVILILVIFNLVFSAVFFDVLKKEIDISNRYLLEQTRFKADLIGFEMQRLEVELLGDLDLIKLSKKDVFENADYLTLNSVIARLSAVAANNQNVSDFFVYLPRPDVIINSQICVDSRTYFDIYINEGTITYQQWLDGLMKPRNREYISMHRLEQNGKFVECTALISRWSLNMLRHDMVVAVMADKSNILDNMMLGMDEQREIIILNEENQVLLSTDENLAREFDGITLSPGRDVKIKGKNYIVSYVDMDTTKWKLVAALPEDAYYAKTYFVMQINAVCMALSLVIAFIMIFYFIRMNYTPIDTIIKQLKNYKGTEIDNTQNEISMIETALEKIAFEHQDMRKKLSEQDEIIRRSVLEDMLKKGNIDNAQFETVLERNQITFRDERFRVITVYVENFEKLFEEEPALSNEKRFHYAKIIISNILNELLNETHYFICMELDGLFTGIINYKAASDIANVILTLEEAQSIIDHEFHFEFSVAVSSEKLQYAELAEAYAETIQIIKYRIFDEDSSIVLYDNIFEPDDSADYSFSSDIERQLMNCISVSDAENAIQFIDVVFAKACKNIRLSKYIMYDIMATFMKLAEKLPDEKKNTFHEKIYVLENLDMSNPTTNMLLEIKDIVKELCAVFSKAKSGESKTVLGIKSYIANTYMDINLSVYSIADHFSLTPSYVSKLFKRYTGDALLEYINKYRIEMAKQIMSDQEGYSIDKIAAMVGYENPRTFTRIFKKYESTVPSKYKNMLHGNT